MGQWGQLSFCDAGSYLMEELMFFHDHAIIILVLVVSFVSFICVSLLMNNYVNRSISEGQQIETIWTMAPALILVSLAFPSLRVLYLLDEVGSPSVTLKSIGHQWYWSYEYTDTGKISFDSYMAPDCDLSVGDYRLLEVDNRIILPSGSDIRVLVTSADVIHSWAVPSLGVKADAVPGRLNQLGLNVKVPGIFYGQCSEICGANHSFMPIVVECISPESFIKWNLASTGM
uniref:Cytochrome c oxidase subunit 2 n=1 Tax=Petaloconchus erectus TaxID=766169 RepID=E2FLW4_9CAEN|nr:cytochrome c oxidase subunit 2 [Petaloconchus erectus]